MPQLMPLNWLFSFLMVLFIMSMMILVYNYICNQKINFFMMNMIDSKKIWKW